MDYRQSGYSRSSSDGPKVFPNNFTRLTLQSPFMSDCSDTDTELFRNTYTSSCYLPTAEDIKLAGMKVFACIMLNAWRKRREDVKRLVDKVKDLNKGSMKVHNQIHVYNTLYRVEQKRNDELTCKLKHSMENINQAKSSCESLTTSVLNLKADKALLDQELQFKYNELDDLKAILQQNKNELFHAMVEQRNLKANISKEQSTVQFLEKQKDKLINEICELSSENRKLEDKYDHELNKKDAELKETNEKIEELNSILIQLKEQAFQAQEYRANNDRLKIEIQQMKQQVTMMQRTLDESLSYRLSTYWDQILSYKKATLEVAYTIAFYLLPATPPPELANVNLS